MENYLKKIEELWQKKDLIVKHTKLFDEAQKIVREVLYLMEEGAICVNYKQDNTWLVNEWIKKAILMHFQTSDIKIYKEGCMKWRDKVDLKFSNDDLLQIQQSDIRLVPGCYVRQGAYIGENVVLMPSFINIGAHVGAGTLVDTWATIGSCAYVGKNCHISGGTGIGGVLEPLQAQPVIIEDNCFIGARSEIAEGVIIGEGSVISMGVFLGASTKIVNRSDGRITFGYVPPYSVVVPGYLPAESSNLPGLACAVIIKQVDANTRAKTAINELLR